ncbi:hypothetical protein CN692_24290 [Bacillus sp. AFS002410]|uniref:hypothetical protein n=1 Tax=Bacillus sp. AFS002410 TaxID=2033481 RepID=UPI000BF055FD|nr:hypothetical protein [Bacillus sp. AFS002410]PEJ48228.1 hypothetical protein CN692_24290 [Bacillus sp. AFS002410]
MFFDVYFKSVNGQEIRVDKVERETMDELSTEITHSNINWFGSESQKVNLNNVIEFRLIEVDKDGFAIDRPDFQIL